MIQLRYYLISLLNIFTPIALKRFRSSSDRRRVNLHFRGKGKNLSSTLNSLDFRDSIEG